MNFNEALSTFHLDSIDIFILAAVYFSFLLVGGIYFIYKGKLKSFYKFVGLFLFARIGTFCMITFLQK